MADLGTLLTELLEGKSVPESKHKSYEQALTYNAKQGLSTSFGLKIQVDVQKLPDALGDYVFKRMYRADTVPMDKPEKEIKKKPFHQEQGRCERDDDEFHAYASGNLAVESGISSIVTTLEEINAGRTDFHKTPFAYETGSNYVLITLNLNR